MKAGSGRPVAQHDLGPPSGRLFELDLLRAISAMMVLMLHYLGSGSIERSRLQLLTGSVLGFPDLAMPTRFGLLGVDYFFIISGVVIAWIAQGATLRSFAISRSARIVPTF